MKSKRLKSKANEGIFSFPVETLRMRTEGGREGEKSLLWVEGARRRNTVLHRSIGKIFATFSCVSGILASFFLSVTTSYLCLLLKSNQVVVALPAGKSCFKTGSPAEKYLFYELDQKKQSSICRQNMP